MFLTWRGRGAKKAGLQPIAQLLQKHFHPRPVEELMVAEGQFPARVRVDLQRAMERRFDGEKVRHFCGVKKEHTYFGVDFADLLSLGHDPALAGPPQYEQVDIGEDKPVSCLKNGLWLLGDGEASYAVLLSTESLHGQAPKVKFNIATFNSVPGPRLAEEFLQHLEDAVREAQAYRGKILSLERASDYSGQASGITVHRLRTVSREQVILPRRTLELLERNVIQFVTHRPQLAKFGQSTKKGLLFYGPPGTGKTHTLHYLTRTLAGHTTLLISAEQVGMLEEYMILARLLQPSLVVIEDADLIARQREEMGGPCEEVLLNRLLNEMDGLKEDADILFVLTTNRPEALEQALASRPGRIDQAIEFPLPDDEGREKLVRLYSQGISLSDELVRDVVRRTERVSAAFIKELMRRSVQFHLERGGTGQIEAADVESALDELLFSGGSLNAKLLAADGARAS